MAASQSTGPAARRQAGLLAGDFRYPLPVIEPTLLFARVYHLYAHVLERTGAEAALAARRLPFELADRPFWLLVVFGSGLLLLWSALAEGDDHAVRTLRAVTLLAGATLPLAAARLHGTVWQAALGGVTILGLVACGAVHRSLARRRRAGGAERAIRQARLWIEGVGLLGFAAGAALLAAGRPVPFRLAFWALFLVRLSVADLLDPSRLAGETGLKRSAAKDLRSAASSGRSARRGASRLRRGLSGLAKGALLLLWIALPLLAALAPGEVAAREWPSEALWLRLYPPTALLLTALLLVGGGFRELPRRPWEGARGIAAGAGTALWVAAVHLEPSFAEYRRSLAGLYLAETVAGFLLGTVSRGKGARG